MKRLFRSVLALALFLALVHCQSDFGTDPAGRLARELEDAVALLGEADGATYRVEQLPSKSGQCTGPYKVQIDEVGIIFFNCNDASGKHVADYSTMEHLSLVRMAKTFVVEKEAGSTLAVTLERQGGQAVIVDVQ